MDRNEEPNPQFIITVPAERVDQLAQALENASIDFDPEADMIAFGSGPDGATNTVNTGDNLAELIEAVNSFLQDGEFSPLIRDDPYDWDHAQRYAALRLCVQEFQWRGFNIHAAHWLAQSRDWEEVAEEHDQVPYSE